MIIDLLIISAVACGWISQIFFSKAAFKAFEAFGGEANKADIELVMNRYERVSKSFGITAISLLGAALVTCLAS